MIFSWSFNIKLSKIIFYSSFILLQKITSCDLLDILNWFPNLLVGHKSQF